MPIFRLAPCHDCGSRREFPLKHLVPSDDLPASLTKEVGHMTHQVALKIVLSRMSVVIGEPQFLNLLLAIGTSLPSYLRTLVSTYVDIL